MIDINVNSKEISFVTHNPESVETDWWENALVFCVPYDWAKEYCGSEDELDLFYWEYTTDETMMMYEKALLDGVVLSENVVENYFGGD